MFDVSNATRAAAQTGVELKGHSGDAGGVDWALPDMLATCWDDGMVRVWRPEIETHMACVESPEEKRWDWCWGS